MTLLIVKLFISIAILYGLYLLYGRTAKNKFRFKAKVTYTNQVNREQPSKKLQKKLLLLLNGDRHTANRLIGLAKSRNPDRSIDWCVEKVIFDLERDRGRY